MFGIDKLSFWASMWRCLLGSQDTGLEFREAERLAVVGGLMPTLGMAEMDQFPRDG